MKSLLVVLWVACDAGAPRPQPVTPAPVEAVSPPVDQRPELQGLSDVVEPPFVAVDGHTYAIVKLRTMCDELTSNLGGVHWRFEVDGQPASFLLHGGGHGIYGDNTTLPGRRVSDEIWDGRYYIAEVSLFRAPAELGDFDCDDHVQYRGTVAAVAPANSLDDARRQLAAIPGAGFHPALRIDKIGHGGGEPIRLPQGR